MQYRVRGLITGIFASKNVVVLLLSLLTNYCTTTQHKPSYLAGKGLKKVQIDGIDCDGGCGVLRRPGHTYKMEFEVAKDSLQCNIRTCHRDEWGPCSEIKSYKYRQRYGVENTGVCPMVFTEFRKDGTSDHVFIDFINGERLDAIIACDGKDAKTKGGYFCQAAVGSTQRVVFDHPVVVEPIQSCKAEGFGFDDSKKSIWTYSVQEGYCTYVFSDGTEFFNLSTFGYRPRGPAL